MTTYIKIDDLKDFVKGYRNDIYDEMIIKINSLPSINPEEMIEEMIMEIKNVEVHNSWEDVKIEKINLLERLLQKFKSYAFSENTNTK